MRTPSALAVCLFAALIFGGCERLSPEKKTDNSGQAASANAEAAASLAKIEQAQAQLRADMDAFRGEAAKFYDDTSGAFFVISYEMSQLATEARKRKDGASADLLAERAKVYANLSRDLQAAADARRPAGVSRTAGAPPAAEMAPPPPAVSASESLAIPGPTLAGPNLMAPNLPTANPAGPSAAAPESALLSPAVNILPPAPAAGTAVPQLGISR